MLPLRLIVPSILSISPRMAESSVDLPEPTFPTIETNYPGATFRLSIVNAYLCFYSVSGISDSELGSKLSLRLPSVMTDFFFFDFFLVFFSPSDFFFLFPDFFFGFISTFFSSFFYYFFPSGFLF